ncbi:hypothetical protein PTTG_07857 [Puccinia triticina 1-1 BBBD Race 1]|uniref:TauD domain-containing protein n=1 Tax=Puccinia triticina (isolate 1-1 / race 1 (BBBD)) TaxID=630390 RepID=A0A180G9W5_PUCT1|nr:hypothetical protein PTTG_07857 [Puccinia triticina 1-1 BBBD Race 1]
MNISRAARPLICRPPPARQQRPLHATAHPQQKTNSDQKTTDSDHRTRGYVTQSQPAPAKILNGPVHPLTPPEPPPRPTPPRKPTEKPEQIPQLTIKHDFEQKTLKINAKPFGIANLSIPYLWLRDACQEAHSIDPSTKQKLFKTTDIPLDIHPIKTTIINNSNPNTNSPPQILIQWSHSLDPLDPKEPQLSRFDLSFLKDLDQPRRWQDERQKTGLLRPTLWFPKPASRDKAKKNRKSRIDELAEAGELSVDYQAFAEDVGVQKMALERLNSLGLLFFHNLDRPAPDQHEFELARLISSAGLDIRRTFYGDLWDVVSRGQAAKNVANTNLALDFHMDLVHFENPPRFQFLHCLKNEVIGGRSGFLDAYTAAMELLTRDPEAFRTLARAPIGFEYINDSHHTYFDRPTIELKPHASIDALIRRPHELLDSLVAVNYAPPFQAPFRLHSRPDSLRAVVAALKSFVELFHADSRAFEIGLLPGQAVAFDNRRILHSRTAFLPDPARTSQPSDGPEGTHVHRWLKGAYVDGDSVWDRIRVLNS